MSFEDEVKSGLKKGNAKLDATADKLALKASASRWTGATLVIVAALVAYALFKAFGS